MLGIVWTGDDEGTTFVSAVAGWRDWVASADTDDDQLTAVLNRGGVR